MLDEEWMAYQAGELTEAEEVLYFKADQGDSVAAKKLLTLRKNYEYEEWEIVGEFEREEG